MERKIVLVPTKKILAAVLRVLFILYRQIGTNWLCGHGYTFVAQRNLTSGCMLSKVVCENRRVSSTVSIFELALWKPVTSFGTGNITCIMLS